MSDYIHIYLRTDEDNMMGSTGWQGHDPKDSIAAYGTAVEAAVIEAFPGAEVDVTTNAARPRVDSDIPGVADTIDAIINDVWQSWEWLRK